MRRYRAAQRRKRESGEREALQLDAPASTPVPPGNIDDAIDWIQSTLRVPSGPLRGQPFRLDDWQCAFLKAALADGVQEAGLSVARKNGKTGLISALLLAYLCGPLTRADFRALVTSLTGRLAQELRNACELTAKASGEQVTVMKSPTPGRIVAGNGSQVDFVAADRATGHASGVDVAVIDEAGLLEESSRELWNAVFSSISGRAGRLLAISVRGRGAMFSEMAARADDPSVVWHEYACSGNKVDLNDEAEWHRANPGLRSGIKSLDYMRKAARRATNSPADQASFRALDLNAAGVDATQKVICAVADWTACYVNEAEVPQRDGLVCVGFDLGSSLSMCAAVALWPRTGRVEIKCALPSEPLTLRERGQADGCGAIYERMAESGELEVLPGIVTPVSTFLQRFQKSIEGEYVVLAAADRFRKAEVLQAFYSAGFEWDNLSFRGTGASALADGSHDVRAFQRRVAVGGFRPAGGVSIAVEYAISESWLRYDGAGNPALDKQKSRARIDVLSALCLASGCAELAAPQLAAQRPLAVAVV